MRVLVCGGRDFDDIVLFAQTMNRLNDERRIDVIIHGCAKGADRMADGWARWKLLEVDRYPANWDQGRSAGPRRNAKMLAEGRPDLVVAFPGGRGTADMVRRAKAAGVRVIEVPREGTIRLYDRDDADRTGPYVDIPAPRKAVKP